MIYSNRVNRGGASATEVRQLQKTLGKQNSFKQEQKMLGRGRVRRLLRRVVHPGGGRRSPPNTWKESYHNFSDSPVEGQFVRPPVVERQSSLRDAIVGAMVAGSEAISRRNTQEMTCPDNCGNGNVRRQISRRITSIPEYYGAYAPDVEETPQFLQRRLSQRTNGPRRSVTTSMRQRDEYYPSLPRRHTSYNSVD